MKNLLLLTTFLFNSSLIFAQESNVSNYSSEDCGFSVEFPGKPTVRKDSVLAQGNLLKITHYFAFSKSGVNHSITCNDFPIAKMLNSKRAILNVLKSGATPRIGGEIQQIEEFKLNGNHGISYIEKSSQFIAYNQILLVGQKLFQLYVSGMNYDASEEAEIFYNSFKIE